MKDTELHCDMIRDNQLMAQLEIGDLRTLNKMIEVGDLPKPSFGGRSAEGPKVRGWHKDVLRRFYMERYEIQQGLR